MEGPIIPIIPAPRATTVAAGHLCSQHLGMWVLSDGVYRRLSSIHHSVALYCEHFVTGGFYGQVPGAYWVEDQIVTLYAEDPS